VNASRCLPAVLKPLSVVYEKAFLRIRMLTFSDVPNNCMPKMRKTPNRQLRSKNKVVPLLSKENNGVQGR